MPPSITEILAEAVAQPKDAVYYHLSRALAQVRPGWTVLETEERVFNLLEFAQSGNCKLRGFPEEHHEWETHWWGARKSPYRLPYNIPLQIQWEGHDILAVVTGLQGQYCRQARSFVMAESQEVANAFFTAVCAWCSEVRGEVLVFADGDWHKSTELYEAIGGASFDNLVLAGDLRETIRQDFETFFAARERYEAYGIPWKRGVLLLGPPGNGKTHTVKALANSLGVPCLYVRSFKARYKTDHENMGHVFRRARESAPCLLVLEDLDSLLDGDNRAFFLNELDGFDANEGLVTLATTNHPERLDPALLDRPSRFDRKYTFNLPALDERLAYLRLRNESLEDALRLSEGAMERLAELTEEFSYAYLKELFLSSMMAWISRENAGSMDAVMEDQVATLREQMRCATEVAVAYGTDEVKESQQSRMSSFIRRPGARP